MRDRALPLPYSLVSVPEARDPVIYEEVVAQFHVATEPSLQPANGQTFCNLFAWSVTLAMGAELPHWVRRTGDPARPYEPGATETNCNRLDAWLGTVGRWGWVPCLDPRVHANAGRPTVALWKNPSGGPGHVAVVLPSPVDGPLLIAQAGARCFFREPITHGFRTVTPRFWTHP